MAVETPALTLPDDPHKLKEIIINLKEECSKRKEEYAKKEKDWQNKFDILESEIKFWKYQVYGRKSERYILDDGTQAFLFNEAEMVFDKKDFINQTIDLIRIPEHTRVKKGRRPLPASLPRKEIIIDIDEKDKICPAGKERKLIGYEVSEKFEIKPPEIMVLQYKRAKYACPDPECIGCEDIDSPIKIAPPLPQILPKTIATPGLLAYITINKFCDHLPFYRLEKILKRLSIDISRQTMCRWMIGIAFKYKILKELMWEELLSGAFMGIDETTLQVIEEPGRSATTKSYIWAFRGGNLKKPTILFEYRETRSGIFLLTLLEAFKGHIQCDAYKGYDDLETLEGIILLACWAHVRRKFFDATKVSKKQGTAHVILAMIQKLYMIEREAKDLTPEERKCLRQEKAVPILKQIKEHLDKKVLLVLPKSLLGIAINYTLKIWDRLIRYVADGRLPIDNNLLENSIRPFCVGRRNWLFSYTPAGATASAFLYSLIETAKASGLEPYWYLRYLFEQLPLAKTREDFKALLPQYVDHNKIPTPPAKKS